MENQNSFRNLNFRKWIQRRNQRLMIFIISFFTYLIIMWVLPATALITLMLFIVPVLIWVASYGWRTALNQVIRYLQRYQIN
jgi:hypothetical protein